MGRENRLAEGRGLICGGPDIRCGLIAFRLACRCFQFDDAPLKQAFELDMGRLDPVTGRVVFQASNCLPKDGKHFAGILFNQAARSPVFMFWSLRALRAEHRF